MLLRVSIIAIATWGCARGGAAQPVIDAPDHGDDDAGIDAPGRPDGPIDSPAGVAGQLLLSEVVLQPSPAELVEIVNPSAQAVDLTNYYLSDNGNYFKLPVGVPTVDSADFIVRFPAGASIPAHGVITVAIDTAANFTTTYPGVTPTFSVGAGASQMLPIAANGTPSLTNTGEMVVLFEWDGTSGLVHDCDIMLAGVPSAANSLINKSGVSQKGETYATDAMTIAAQATAPGSGKSTKRLLLPAGHETATGGNGLTGEDDTSENTAATWDTTYTAPTPGQVPPALQ